MKTNGPTLRCMGESVRDRTDAETKIEDVVITLERRITPEMECLRETSHEDFICGADEFDSHALHVTAWHASRPVGMVRLNSGPDFALAKWSDGEITIPGGDVVEMTRGVVHADFRGRGIYKCLMWESMIRAELMGKHIALAAVEPQFPGKPFLESLGFKEAQKRCFVQSHFYVQPIECILDRKNEWLSDYQKHREKSRNHGLEVRSELARV